MTLTEITFEEFITWFSAEEDIPLETRIDMLEHMEKLGHLDEKTSSFIDQYLKNKDARMRKRGGELFEELRFNTHQLNLNSKPENTYKAHVISSLKSYLGTLVNNFKNNFKAFDSNRDQSLEQTEQQQEQSQVAALKASVGA